MKKPLSIQDHMMVLSSTAYPYEKIRSVFSLRVVIHEFFQKKLNYIKATQFFLYDPLTTSFTRLWRDCTVGKKHYSWNDLTKINAPTFKMFIVLEIKGGNL